ncbi:hypothetical protein [Methylocystis sp. SB2]|uniref:hypothetical protein n=1 Tax=Methylocystis sp. (strain SB2) TaxID=743836 RepID=UPI0003FA2A06|nr:hypothetical protein [Methylocystis sp. SB2]ULO25231.1 hypothetical protein LNB28_07575 [Methylocystis sp. SB2]
MPHNPPVNRRKLDTSALKAQSDALEKVGKLLRAKFDKILTEPLPEGIADLLVELHASRRT